MPFLFYAYDVAFNKKKIPITPQYNYWTAAISRWHMWSLITLVYYKAYYFHPGQEIFRIFVLRSMEENIFFKLVHFFPNKTNNIADDISGRLWVVWNHQVCIRCSPDTGDNTMPISVNNLQIDVRRSLKE